MPISHETSSLTEVYAQSFFESVFAKSGKAGIESALDELQAIVQMTRDMPKFGEVLSNPGISSDQRGAMLTRALSGRASDETQRLLQVLNAKDRISVLGGVVASLDKMVQERMGRVEVAVSTSAEMPASEQDSLRQRLSTALGRDVVLSHKVEPGMLGGIKLRIGDQLIDGSFATQLRRLKDKLSTEGGANIRAKMASVLQA